MSALIALLRGVPHKFGVPRPVFVGLARGLVEATLLGAVAAATVYVSSAEVPTDLTFVAAGVITGLRTLEGFIDQIDPSKSRGA